MTDSQTVSRGIDDLSGDCSLAIYLGSGALLVNGMCEVATVSDGQELGRMKDAQLEQIEPGAAVHLSLEQFQPVDMVLHHAIAPWQS